MKAQATKLWIALRTSYWFVPAAMAIAAGAVALLTILIDARLDWSNARDIEWLYLNTPGAARALLSTVAGSMITMAGVVFAITIAAVAYAASQYGPQLLTNFMRDRGNQITLGTFVSTFVFCLIVLRSIKSPGEATELAEGFTPHVSVLLALLLTFGSVGVLIYYIHHVAESIHLAYILEKIGRQLRREICSRFPDQREAARHPGQAQANDVPLSAGPEEQAVEVRADQCGYIQALDVEALVALATESDLVIRLDRLPGDFIYEGRVLARVSPQRRMNPVIQSGVRAAFATGRQRTPEQDILFLIDEVLEIAARALSPGQNDPYSAVACVDRLAAALAVRARRATPDSRRFDDCGNLRLIAAPLTFELLADRIFDSLRLYACRDPMVTLAAMGAISHLAELVNEERRCLLTHAEALRSAAEAAGWHLRDRARLADLWRDLQRSLNPDGMQMNS